MNNFLKLTSASVLAVALAACGSPETYEAETAETTQTESTEMAKTETKPKTMEPKGVMFGGAMMYPNKTIVENASAADNLTTLVTLVKQANLVETLSSPGPFTVFAPTDAAFDEVPSETVNALMEDNNRPMLANILTYHVVAGTVTSTDLVQAIKDNGGTFSTPTVAGGELTFRLVDGKVQITDGKNNISTVTAADVKQSNGVVHVIDTVMMPQ